MDPQQPPSDHDRPSQPTSAPTTASQTQTQSQPPSSSELPPEAIALATRFFAAARTGQMDIFQQGLPAGLPANMTNEKGDSLVGTSLVSHPTDSVPFPMYV